MKNNKKGFTLIELLAVIAILAILIVIAVPAVLNLFNDAKENSFVTQAQSIFKTAEQQKIANQLNPGASSNVYCYLPANFAGGTNEVDEASSMELDASKNVAYKVMFNASGEITKISVLSKDLYLVEGDASAAINVGDVDAGSLTTVPSPMPTSCSGTW